eukprot:CAMPEP_0172385264 /NCGR_PEP_ID=MMETSP1061-20121228/2937_1 /TAXON_ID=37318 /ORGANISM="Pseudo-nitzschia pungens, Strain cf. pungens" /LENGTH=77 /DNA_ID=CAMNT_0013114203 /DNA_START=196 /DNA_END=429 /DNA_ORIENTATION=+
MEAQSGREGQDVEEQQRFEDAIACCGWRRESSPEERSPEDTRHLTPGKQTPAWQSTDLQTSRHAQNHPTRTTATNRF